MANQRMFIRCLSCGKEKMLAKRLIESFHMLHCYESFELEKDWDKWFDDHRWGFCGDGGRGLDGFELIYEDPQEWEEGFSG